MSWRMILIFSVVCPGFVALSAADERLADHVVLISIDGFRPDFYREAQWPTPNLQEMAAQGVSADFVRGVFPSVTYPSHTTLITGTKPATHGIYYNSPFEPDHYTGAWFWFEQEIKTPTIWDVVGQAGLSTASLFWPVSVGAPITYNVPEIWPLEKNIENRFQWLKQYVTPTSLLEELEDNALGKLDNLAFESDRLMFDANTAQAACYLIRKYKPNLLTLHLLVTDFAQHTYGRDSQRLRQALGGVDHGIGLIREALHEAGIQDRSAIIVTGDHGFVNVQSALSPNVWLAQAGLREVRHLGEDWRATFHTTGASAFLILKDPKDTRALAEVKSILQALPAARKRLFRIVEQDELQAIGGPPVPLALTPVQGIRFAYGATGEDLAPTGYKAGDHGYLPDFEEIYTGFIGYGSGFRQGVRTKMIGLEDIAPNLTHLLNLPMDNADGILYPGFFSSPAGH